MEAKQKKKVKKSLLSYPQKVYNVLKFCEEQGREDIISWVNDGTAFKVNNVEEFERDLLPRYFNTHKYYTFTRTLCSYGFTGVRKGRQTGIYSHPSFNRNDPLSPSRMKRVTKTESRKGAAKNCTVSNPFKALNNRSFNLMSALLSGRGETLQFPSFFDEVRGENDGSTATVFGRSYHTIAPEVAANRVASELVHQIPTGSELTGIFDSEGDSMGARPYPNPTHSTLTSTSIPPSFHVVASSNGTANDRQSDGLYILGGGHMAVASPRNVMNDGSEQENKINVIPYHAPDGHNQFQEQQDYLKFIPC